VVYPEGVQFVVSIFEVKQEKGLVVAGAKQRDVVQLKDRRAVATGGWRFASFDPRGQGHRQPADRYSSPWMGNPRG
jgi:hypothetical protein